MVGAGPGGGVKSDTKIIRDILLTFKQLYDKDKLIVEIPRIFNQFQGSDAKMQIEIITSSMLQTLRMDIVGHQAKDPVVYVFVSTHI